MLPDHVPPMQAFEAVSLRIKQDAASKQPTPPMVVPHTQVLEKLLEQITVVDFREEAGLTQSDKSLQQKHYLITVAEQIIRLAKKNQWGVWRSGSFLYVYNGACWKPLEEEEVKAFLQAAAEKMGVDKFDARFVRFANSLYEQFQSTAYLPSRKSQQDVVKINLGNGTYHIGTDRQELRPHDRDDFLTYQLPFAFEPSAKAPLFEQFLKRVLPDHDCQQLLAEYLGYIFVSPSKLKLEKTLLLYGTGANGKSVVFEVITALLGPENVVHYSLQSLTAEASTSRPHLANALVNYASEINGKLDANVFKQLVSGEPVEARFLYGQSFTLTDYAKLLFNCNELPADVEHTAAYFRRFLIIPFGVTIPEGEQDSQLAAKIIASELSGVFNWVMEGLRRLLHQARFTDCEAARQEVERYKLQSDSVRSFLAEQGYVADSDSKISRQELYQEYRGFCQNEGYRHLNSSNFAKRLAGCGIHGTRRNSGHVHFVAKKALLS